jgi:hypothetical protein
MPELITTQALGHARSRLASPRPSGFLTLFRELGPHEPRMRGASRDLPAKPHLMASQDCAPGLTFTQLNDGQKYRLLDVPRSSARDYLRCRLQKLHVETVKSNNDHLRPDAFPSLADLSGASAPAADTSRTATSA